MQPIFLIGYRCTGKTSTGKLLADALNRKFLDTDHVLESTCATTIADMVKLHGWDYFRKKETEILKSIELKDNPIVATGGGIVLAPENRSFLKKHGLIVYLYATAQVLTQRIGQDKANTDQRPNLTDENLCVETAKMIEKRTPLYKELAHLSIDTEKYTPDQVARLIQNETNQS